MRKVATFPFEKSTHFIISLIFEWLGPSEAPEGSFETLSKSRTTPGSWMILRKMKRKKSSERLGICSHIFVVWFTHSQIRKDYQKTGAFDMKLVKNQIIWYGLMFDTTVIGGFKRPAEQERKLTLLYSQQANTPKMRYSHAIWFDWHGSKYSSRHSLNDFL